MTDFPFRKWYRTAAAGGSALLFALLPSTSAPAADGRLLLESAPGSVGPVSWQGLELEARPGPQGSWRLEADQLEIFSRSGKLVINCSSGGVLDRRPRCREGELRWRPAGSAEALTGRFQPAGDDGDVELALLDGQILVRLTWPKPGTQSAATLDVEFNELDLERLPTDWIEPAGLSYLAGRATGKAKLDGPHLAYAVALSETDFDSPDGRFAGGGLAVEVSGEMAWAAASGEVSFEFDATQEAGELLAGPVYLPPPAGRLSLQASGRLGDDGSLDLERLSVADGESLRVDGSLGLLPADAGWLLSSLQIDRLAAGMPGTWERWLQGPAAALGFGDMAVDGRVEGELSWVRGAAPRFSLAFENLSVRDANGRLALEELEGRVAAGVASPGAELAWSRLELFSLRFGASRLVAIQTGDGAWVLDRPLALPLLGGAVVIDALTLRLGRDPAPSMDFDARIEPLDLADLTGMLGLPEFGGELSGRFPGVRVAGDRIEFTGGIDIQAFSGQIRLGDLSVERPFGSLPALAGQVEIERLDLAKLTGAFNFGHMEGQLSGWMRDLRLLDWRPVAMDARVYTHADAPRRRISQRAVENLSRLGGGAAALGVTLLDVFEEFPYRRAGLACRLSRNICHLDGVAPHPSGGFYLVEGRSLPRLDVIGHRRLVDWPRLVAQLEAITRE